MKKPNITEGEWYPRLDFQVKGVVDEDRDTIAVIHSMRETADAQAISAVPDLIEDEIKNYQLLLSIKNNTDDPELKDRVEDRLLEMQPTLKKAGVENA